MWQLIETARNGDALLVRQFALVAATVVFYTTQTRFHTDGSVTWVLLVACLLNVALAIVGAGRSPARQRLVRVGSPVLGIAIWSSLIWLTEGVESSPFLPSLWLEILLGALTFSSGGIALITGGAVLGLWLAEPAPSLHAVALVLHGVFMVAMGAGVLVVHRRWRRVQGRLSRQIAEQTRSLQDVQAALEDARALSVAGEHSARLAHRLKNAVHSLRGFARLVESDFQTPATSTSIDGLRVAIDQLDHLAGSALRPIVRSDEAEWLDAEQVRAILEAVADHLVVSYPALHLERHYAAGPGQVRCVPGALRDIASNLLLNSAEATNGHGRVRLETRVVGEGWLLRVTDDGPGLAQHIAARLFRPGVTTKPAGSGVGLYSSERQAAASGGRMWVEPVEPRGTSFHVLLPLVERPC